MPTRRSPLSFSLVALALSASGCGKIRDVSACRGLAHDINTAIDHIEALRQARTPPADDAEALRKAKPVNVARTADGHGQLAKALEPRSVGEQPIAVAL